MEKMEIYYNDLNVEAKKEFDAKFGLPDTHNHDIIPLCIFEQETDCDSTG